MKRTVLAAALLAAFSMPAFAGDTVRTDDASTTYVDPVTTSATTQAGQSDMLQATSAMKSGCMNRKTALNMM